MTSGGVTLSSSAAYTTDGNRLSTTTDAAGKVTRYSYNANTNVLEWVQYPEDTASTRTNYTYDSMYRLASAAATTDTGSALTASYTYTNDLLTSIATGSSTYHFTYGTFGLRTSVKVGSQTLASYTYTNDRNNYLQKLAYGNGDSVQYTYDSQGRVTKQTYGDGDIFSHKYDINITHPNGSNSVVRIIVTTNNNSKDCRHWDTAQSTKNLYQTIVIPTFLF